MAAHDGGNGLSKEEYARVHATVCGGGLSREDHVAWIRMCALYIITHAPILAVRAYTDVNMYVVLAAYLLSLCVVAYTSWPLFAKYVTQDYFDPMVWMSLVCLAFFTGQFFVYDQFNLFWFIGGMSMFPALVESFINEQQENKWKVHVNAHANRNCHFHVDCLCTCDTCMSGPDGAARHTGDETHGVDMRAYLAAANVTGFDVWALTKIVGITVAVPLYMMLGTYGVCVTMHISARGEMFKTMCFITYMIHVGAVIMLQAVMFGAPRANPCSIGAKITQHLPMYDPVVLCLCAWGVVPAGFFYYAIAVFDTIWPAAACVAIHLLGFVVIYLVSLAGFRTLKTDAETAHVRANIRSECTAHPQCLCTCDRCGGAPAAPVRARPARRSARAPGALRGQ